MKTEKNMKVVVSALIVLVLGITISPSVAGIWVDPNVYDVNVIQDCTLTETLTVGNDDVEDLSFTLRNRETSSEILSGLSAGTSTMAPVGKTGEDKIVLEYEFEEPVITKNAEYDVVRIEALELYRRTGAPIVPVRPVTVMIPFGKKVVNSRVIILETHQLPGTYRLPPAQKPYPLSHWGIVEPTEPDPKIYGRAKPWPGTAHQQVGTQSKRGYRLLTVNLFPLQYIPVTGKLRYASRLRLEIRLVNSAKTGVVKPTESTKARLRSRVDNPSTLLDYPASGMAVRRSEAALTLPGGGPYQYVIVTNEDLEAAPGPWNFQTLCDAKIAKGITATIVTTEWIYTNYDGTRPDGNRDDQTRIRNFLIDAYQNWSTEYVLLGGTNSIVPARMFWAEGFPGAEPLEEHFPDWIPVDMYYGCVEPPECTFDYDADGFYGEPGDGIAGGEVDLCAELYVGRAAVKNATELTNFIRKTLTYASANSSEYRLRVSMLGEYLYPTIYGKDHLAPILQGTRRFCGFEYPRIDPLYFKTAGCLPENPGACWPLYDKDAIWPKSDVIDLMNGGIHIFQHTGHSWYRYNMKLDTSDLAALTNKDYFFVYSLGCMPGGFARVNDCFAEVITSMEHGAFAVIMNARLGWIQGIWLAQQFWNDVLCQGILELGCANQISKEDFLWDINGDWIRWEYYQTNLFGDPQQKFQFEADSLQVTPTEGFQAISIEGDPFKPQCMVYTLTNINDTEAVNWTAWDSEDWLSVEPNEGVLDPCDSIEVRVCISPEAGLLDPNLYVELLAFQNKDTNSIKRRPITLTVKPPDCFTESFDDSGVDLAGVMLTFLPDGSGSYYEACRERTREFPIDSNGGTYVPLWDDDFAEVFLGGKNPNKKISKKISFYGTKYNRFYIGSNGYITFGNGDTGYSPTLENHFNMPRISGLFADLVPPDDRCISYKKLEDRIAVTFQDVQLFGDKTSKNSFQIEMFYVDDTIRITWLDVAKTPCVAGLSRGRGLPPVFFEESDLNKYPHCWPWCDFDRDYAVNFTDFAVMAMHWLDVDCNIPYWCGKADLDFSGIVGTADLDIFAGDWLTETEQWWLWPVSHWKFDEGSGDIAYDSVGNNDGTIYGAQWTTGQIGGALSFDGNGDYVDIADNTALQLPSALTVTAWVYPIYDGGDYYVDVIAVKGQNVGWGPQFNYRIAMENSNLYTWGVCKSGSELFFHSGTPIYDAWQHLALTADGTTCRAYINGIEVASRGAPGPYLTFPGYPVQIGGHGVTNARWFSGLIDDVRVYDRALSMGEIWELYAQGKGKAYNPNPADGATAVDPNTTLTWSPAGKDVVSHDVYLGTTFDDVNDANTADAGIYKDTVDVNSFDPGTMSNDTTYYWRIDEVGASNTYKGDVWSFTTFVLNLVSWWQFEEGTGTHANDSVGSNDGTLVGGPNWVAGKIGSHALDFNGVEDYVALPDTIKNSLGTNYTVSAWVNTNTISRAHAVAAYRQFDSWEIFFQLDQYNADVRFIVMDDSRDIAIASSSGAITTGGWYHVAGVREGNTLHVYVNGIKGTSDSAIFGTISSNNFKIGALQTSASGGTPRSYFDGNIDDVRIYDVALTSGDIQQLYQQGL
ncbi:MAG: LamG-like jellyroll fold domain-containing protein [Planctomycetota bacterium]|jgi:hypothetical protein